MMTGSYECDDKKLAVLLDGDENSEEFSQLSKHVEGCAHCQRRLEALSGDVHYWDVQREMLRPLDGDEGSSGVLYRYRGGETSTWRRPSVDEAAVRQMLAPAGHPEMLGRLGRYEIERLIGSGGMGIVLKGFDAELNRPVAIKVLAPHLARVGAARQRFAREARAAAAVVHEHVVAIHSVESGGDTHHDSHLESPFLVMQYVPGESLQARVSREGPLSVAEILRIGLQAASGLAAAHAQGLVHRDVKPANILLENDVERAYLTDFGLARASDDASLTYTGMVAGTPHYMSPEQADGQPVDHRSDLFSLGSVIYFMATGHPPFRADRPMAVLKRTCHDPHRPAWHVNAEIPSALSSIIDRLLAKKPSERFSTASELKTALENVLSDLQQGKVKPGQRSQTHWKSWATAGAFGAAAFGLVWLGATLWNGGLGPAKKSTKQEEALVSAPAMERLEKIDPSPPEKAQEEFSELERMLEELKGSSFPLEIP
jgi:eukaryotic-like serine/threonine-protein kinase